MAKAVDPAAAPPKIPLRALAARPLQLLRQKLCSSLASLARIQVADGEATGLRGSGP